MSATATPQPADPRLLRAVQWVAVAVVSPSRLPARPQFNQSGIVRSCPPFALLLFFLDFLHMFHYTLYLVSFLFTLSIIVPYLCDSISLNSAIAAKIINLIRTFAVSKLWKVKISNESMSYYTDASNIKMNTLTENRILYTLLSLYILLSTDMHFPIFIFKLCSKLLCPRFDEGLHTNQKDMH